MFRQGQHFSIWCKSLYNIRLKRQNTSNINAIEHQPINVVKWSNNRIYWKKVRELPVNALKTGRRVTDKWLTDRYKTVKLALNGHSNLRWKSLVNSFVETDDSLTQIKSNAENSQIKLSPKIMLITNRRLDCIYMTYGSSNLAHTEKGEHTILAMQKVRMSGLLLENLVLI